MTMYDRDEHPVREFPQLYNDGNFHPRSSPPPQPSVSVFVINVPRAASERELEALFSPAGEIASVKIQPPRPPTNPTTVAYVNYKSAAAAQAACAMHITMHGSVLVIRNK
jgi:RNA recognition motif-containing protein